MNERIKELADLAAHDTRAIHNNAYWRMQEQMAEDITWRERFAELIINDFLSICEAEAAGYVKLRKSTCDFEEKNIYAEGESASDRIRIITKKKFGVK